MANYLTTHYKGKYRILPEVCLNTNDFVRDKTDGYDNDMVYISCQNGNKIYYWGLNDSRRAVLSAYIPSIVRGRKIQRTMKKQKIEFFDYDESDEEIIFKFNAVDIEQVAKLLKARTSGASISPFSNKNLPKSDIKLPDEELARYKEVICNVGKERMLAIRNANTTFLNDVLAKKLRPKGTRKLYDYKTDMKTLKLSRDVKSYIWYKGLWEDYLEFMKNEIVSFDMTS